VLPLLLVGEREIKNKMSNKKDRYETASESNHRLAMFHQTNILNLPVDSWQFEWMTVERDRAFILSVAWHEIARRN
jgi:hypothetical protein